MRSELRKEAVAAREAGEELLVCLFAAEVVRSFGPGDPVAFLESLDGRGGVPFDPRLAPDKDGASRLAAAFELAGALGLAMERKPGRIVLLGSGRHTGDDPAASLARLLQAGLAFEQRDPGPPELGDLALLELQLPAQIEAEAPLGGVARLSYRAGRCPPALAELVLHVVSPVRDKTLRIPLELPATGGHLEVPVKLGPAGFGRTRVDAHVRLQLVGPGGERFDDPLPENDRCEASTRARGELVVAAIAVNDKLPELRRWLAPSGRSSLQGLQWVFETTQGLAVLIDELDAVIAFDLAPSDLPQELLGDFIQRGGGFLATSGWGLLRDWYPGRDSSGLAGRLPLEPAPRDSPPREIVLLVDGSGSMQGERFELVRRATLDLVAAALPSDHVTLRFFRTQLGAPRLIKARTDTSSLEQAERISLEAAEAARRLIDLEVPEGSTYVLSSLEHFAEQTYEGDVLALVLTDGEEREGIANLDARTSALHAKFRASKKRIVAIAIRAKPRAVDFLGVLIPDGDEVLHAEELSQLQEIFRREVTGAQVRDGEIPVHAVPRAPGTLAFEIEARGGVLPPLERLVRNRLRPGAELLWESERGEPVLAAMRSGSGRTAMLSSLPSAGWASRYTDVVGLGEPRLFGALARWLARRTSFAARELGARTVGEEIQVAGFGDEWPLRLEAQLVDVLRGTELAQVVLRPPGVSGSFAGSDARRVRSARLPMDLFAARGSEPLLLRLPDPDPAEAPWILPLSRPRSPEFAHEERELVMPSVGTSRGRTRDAGNPAQSALGPVLLGLGLGLLFAFALLRSR